MYGLEVVARSNLCNCNMLLQYEVCDLYLVSLLFKANSKLLLFLQILQAVMSVTRPHSDVFLVIWIEKVLQGSISQTVEPYLKSMDMKSIQKLQRTIKTCCLRFVKLIIFLSF